MHNTVWLESITTTSPYVSRRPKICFKAIKKDQSQFNLESKISSIRVQCIKYQMNLLPTQCTSTYSLQAISDLDYSYNTANII